MHTILDKILEEKNFMGDAVIYKPTKLILNSVRVCRLGSTG